MILRETTYCYHSSNCFPWLYFLFNTLVYSIAENRGPCGFKFKRNTSTIHFIAWLYVHRLYDHMWLWKLVKDVHLSRAVVVSVIYIITPQTSSHHCSWLQFRLSVQYKIEFNHSLEINFWKQYYIANMIKTYRLFLSHIDDQCFGYIVLNYAR